MEEQPKDFCGLKKYLYENKAVFIKPLVFAVCCVVFYWVIPPLAAFIKAGYAFAFAYFDSTWWVDAVLWLTWCGFTLRDLWNWEL